MARHKNILDDAWLCHCDQLRWQPMAPPSLSTSVPKMAGAPRPNDRPPRRQDIDRTFLPIKMRRQDGAVLLKDSVRTIANGRPIVAHKAKLHLVTVTVSPHPHYGIVHTVVQHAGVFGCFRRCAHRDGTGIDGFARVGRKPLQEQVFTAVLMPNDGHFIAMYTQRRSSRSLCRASGSHRSDAVGAKSLDRLQRHVVTADLQPPVAAAVQ